MPFSGPCLSMPMLGSPLRRPATVELLWHGRLELILPGGPGSATWSWCCWGFKGQWWSIQVSKASWRIHYRHLTASKWKWVTGIAASSYYSRPGKHRYLCVTIPELKPVASWIRQGTFHPWMEPCWDLSVAQLPPMPTAIIQVVQGSQWDSTASNHPGIGQRQHLTQVPLGVSPRFGTQIQSL